MEGVYLGRRILLVFKIGIMKEHIIKQITFWGKRVKEQTEEYESVKNRLSKGEISKDRFDELSISILTIRESCMDKVRIWKKELEKLKKPFKDAKQELQDRLFRDEVNNMGVKGYVFPNFQKLETYYGQTKLNGGKLTFVTVVRFVREGTWYMTLVRGSWQWGNGGLDVDELTNFVKNFYKTCYATMLFHQPDAFTVLDDNQQSEQDRLNEKKN